MYNDKILKNMKRINTLVTLLILSIMEVYAQSMVGTWYSIGEDNEQDSTEFDFKSNGTFSFKQKGNVKAEWGFAVVSELYTGRYVKDGKSLALTFNKSSYNSTISFTISDQIKSKMASNPSLKSKMDASLNQAKSEMKQKLAMNFEKLAAIGLPCQISLLNDRYLEFTWGKDFITFSKKGHNDKSPYDLEAELKAIFPETNSSSEANDKENDEYADVYEQVEEMPEFPGGMSECMKFLGKSIKYPKISQENGVQGKVIVKFIVNEDGSISNAKVVSGVDPYLDAEAIRVIGTMPRWKPGKQRGVNVRVKYTMPITFRCQ
jgi:TonB family protein